MTDQKAAKAGPTKSGHYLVRTIFGDYAVFTRYLYRGEEWAWHQMPDREVESWAPLDLALAAPDLLGLLRAHSDFACEATRRKDAEQWAEIEKRTAEVLKRFDA